MKTILSFLFVAVFAVNSFAQNSNLTIFSEDGLPFYLILNGIRQNEKPETNVRVDGLVSDYYTTKVIFSDKNLPIIERKMLMVIDADGRKGEATYKIKADKKGEQVLRYFSFTPAAQVLPPPPNVIVHSYNAVPMAAISFTETTSTTSTTSSSTMGGGSSDNVSIGINMGGINIGASVVVDDHAGHNHSTQVSHQTTTTTTSTNFNNNNNVVVVAEPACMPMERNLFQSALTSIKGQSFSDTQLSQAKEITASNCLNAMQIKEICKIFSFEDTKLEYAKFAYQYCFDRNNYWQINDSFSFKSSVTELNDYISGY